MADVFVHLLDVGREEYGDAVLCDFGGTTVLIDGAHTGDQDGSEGHDGIVAQLAALLDESKPEGPHVIDLLIVSHAHEDHIGCLPWLVEHDVVRPKWALVSDPQMAWGRDTDAGPIDAVNDAERLAAAMREEVRTDGSDDRDIEKLIDAAASLERNYTEMIDTMTSRGTKVVRYGRDSHAPLKRAFKKIGLKILGPPVDQVLRTAELIDRRLTDAVDVASHSLDAAPDLVSAYRQLISSLDATSRPGHLVNLQSIVVSFAVGTRRFLFTGDMQLADPDSTEPEIVDGIASVLDAIEANGPYGFMKLSHHGSPNGLNDEVMQRLGKTKIFGICAGEQSGDHPSVEVLELINNAAANVKWARTDRNGATTFKFAGARTTITPAEGELNDMTPPDGDLSPKRTVSRPLPFVPAPAAGASRANAELGGRNDVEVVTRVPHLNTKVTVTIEVDPGAPTTRGAGDYPPMRVAVGRQLPNLLFVSSRDALARNIGELEASEVLDGIRAAGMTLVENVDSVDAKAAADAVSAALSATPFEGVVLVGGYDVVPSFRVNCIPDDLRDRIGGGNDPDDFMVWSDDEYGDLRDELLPVSRIPDGKSADLVRAALAANASDARATRTGVRNVERPFADEVFKEVAGDGVLSVSQPSVFNDPEALLEGERVYLMLHGDWIDSSRFWGEDTPNNIEAVNMSNVPLRAGRVVFTGCCWGALTVDTPANRVVPGRTYGVKTPGASLALGFLQAGAHAFVGCTGAHYSPTEAPYDYYGGPLHKAFWAALDSGAAPAVALAEAKVEFARGMPHRHDPMSQAIEMKILRQYTCLGLGW